MENGYGPHLLLDLEGCPSDLVSDMKRVFWYLNELPKVLDMEMLDPPKVLDFVHPTTVMDNGVSGYCMIVTSHCSFHSYPFRNGYAFLDIFSCKPFDVQKAVDFVKLHFQPQHIEKWLIQRGKNFPR